MSSPITHVAIRFQGIVYALPRPNRHHHVIWMIVKMTGAKYVDGDQGFLDEEGQYLDRKMALIVAEENNQILSGQMGTSPLNILFSEDVW